MAIKHPQLHFLPYCRASKEERENCSSDTASQHWSWRSDGLENLQLILSKHPQASVVSEPRAVNPARPTACSLLCVQLLEKWSHLLPWAWGSWRAMGMASMAHHQCVHAHPFSSISFSLCCAPALKDKLLLYNLYGRRQKTSANDFYQGAGDTWNMNWSVGRFASALVDAGPMFRIRCVFKFLLESVLSSDCWDFKMWLALQLVLGL